MHKYIKIKMDLVRCNALKPNGEPCMTTFPNENTKHDGPCPYCAEHVYGELLRKKKITMILREEIRREKVCKRVNERLKKAAYIN